MRRYKNRSGRALGNRGGDMVPEAIVEGYYEKTSNL